MASSTGQAVTPCCQCGEQCFYIVDIKYIDGVYSGGTAYCITCYYNSERVCTVCRAKKRRSDFSSKNNYTVCYACEWKRRDNYHNSIVPHIEELFKEFKTARLRYKHAKIPTTEEFTFLLTELEEHFNSGYWAARFMGTNNLPAEEKKEKLPTVPLFFTAEQATQLWSLVEKCVKFSEADSCPLGTLSSTTEEEKKKDEKEEKKKEEEKEECSAAIHEESSYSFAFAMAPSLLLGHLMTPLHGPWHIFSDVTTKEKIIRQWEDKWSLLYRCKPFTIATCGICLENVESSSDYAVCVGKTGCQQVSHAKCKLAYLKSKEKHLCEYCRREYQEDDDILLQNYKYFSQNSDGSLHILSWKDHLEEE